MVQLEEQVNIRKIFLLLAFAIFTSMLGAGIVSPLLPLYAKQMGASNTELGIIFAAFGITHAVLLPIIGRISDRIGRKRFLCMGLFSYTLVSLGYIWAGTVFELGLIRFLHGATASMAFPIAQAYVGDITPAEEEGRWMGYFQGAAFAGLGIGPLLAGVIADQYSMSATFISMGAINLIAFFGVLIFLPESKERGVSVVELSFREMSKSNIMRGLCCYRVAIAIGTGGLHTFIPVFASSLGVSMTLIGVLLAVRTPISLLQAYTGRLADKLSRRHLIIIGTLITVIGITLIPFFKNFEMLLVFYAIVALGVTLSMPAASALAVEEGRKFGMGSTMGIFILAMSIGQTVGAITSGRIADILTLDWAFYLMALAGLLGAVSFFRLTREKTV